MPPIKRQLSPAEVIAALDFWRVSFEFLKKPRPPDPENETAGEGRNPEPAADQSTNERNKSTAAGTPSARGRR